jgi:hypothetical protein
MSRSASADWRARNSTLRLGSMNVLFMDVAGRGRMAGKPKAKPKTPTILRRWVEISRMRKTLMSWPAWSEPEPPAPATTARPRSELLSVAAETTEVVIPLGDAAGVGLQGTQLRLNAWAYRRMHEVTATLEVAGGRSFVTIARIDAWPADPHMNTLARTVPKLRSVPRVIDGSHLHSFGDNARLGGKAFRPPFNLPIAVPLPELTSFRAFLRTVAKEFVIIGLEDFDPPAWQEYLL